MGSIDVLTKDKEEIVLSNLNLVDYVIKKQMHIPIYDSYYEDYQQEGRLALIIATMRYDASKGYAFSTYAISYISGYIKKYKRGFVNGLLKVPRTAMDLVLKISKLYLDGYTMEEVCLQLGISNKEYSELLSAMNVQSIENPAGSDSDGNNLYLRDLVGEYDKNIVDILGEERVIECIEKVANSYKNDKHKNIWYDYIYPAYFGERVTNDALGRKYGVAQSSVNRIINKGKNKLKEYLEE